MTIITCSSVMSESNWEMWASSWEKRENKLGSTVNSSVKLDYSLDLLENMQDWTESS